MKVRIPQRIKIGLHSYKVLFNPHLQVEEEKAGTINHRTQRLEMDSNYPQSQREVIFWHEIIHGISNNYRLGMAEDVVDNLSNGIVQCLQDNFDIEFDFSDIPTKIEIKEE